ncbi:MAG: hypothetical protein HS100_20640 [Anaerolineales bacterium]|nr:hypothetical protein [Anaerolineales bacterium]
MLTTSVTILLAFLGYIVTYLNNLRLSQRAERLQRINRQLGELYGPLFALNHASDIAWRAFRSKHRPNNAYYFGEGANPSDEELKVWRLWMSSVFMPINSQMYEILLTKSDLLIESEMPDCLLKLCAHVAAYKAVIQKWERKDYSEHTSLVNYPGQSLSMYTRESFQKLKVEQRRLLGKPHF